ncbi:hypothetical protein GEMRC1_012599 [Eukaryota sp. GEM-RC1]
MIGSFVKYSKTASQTVKSGNFLIRDAALLGELAKFTIAPPSFVLKCLGKCLSKFHHHMISAACTLLEGCGRFLYHNEHVRPYLQTILERLQKITQHRILDDRMKSMISNAFFSCVPPEKATVEQNSLTTVQRWIVYSVSNCFKSPVRSAESLRRIDWTEEETEFVIETVIKSTVLLGHLRLYSLAKMVLSIGDRRPDILVRIVDDAMDAIKLGLVIGDGSRRQLRLSIAQFLGNLANLGGMSYFTLTKLASELIFHCSGPDTINGVNMDNFRALLALSLVRPMFPLIYRNLKKQYSRNPPFKKSVLNHPITIVVLYVQFYVYKIVDATGEISSEVICLLDDCISNLNGYPQYSNLSELMEILQQVKPAENEPEDQNVHLSDHSEVENDPGDVSDDPQSNHDSDAEHFSSGSDWSAHEAEEEETNDDPSQSTDEFEQALKAIVSESISSSFSAQSISKSNFDVNVPLVRKQEDSLSLGQSDFKVVRLLRSSKKPGRFDSKSIVVPAHSLAFEKKQDDAQRDHDELKRAILTQVETQVKEDSRKQFWVKI